jgi:hypothetical protein
VPLQLSAATFSLLDGEGGGSTTTAAAVDEADEFATQNQEKAAAKLGPVTGHWVSNVTAQLLVDHTRYHRLGLAQHPLLANVTVNPDRGYYYPLVYINDFYVFEEHLSPINETVSEVPLHIYVGSISMIKYMLYSQMLQAFSMHENMGTMSTRERDDIKHLIVDTNIYLLGLTMVVSVLHSVFDFLAFKNDVQHWRSRKSYRGLSGRTVALNVFLQIIILLYLLDNDTSYLVLVSTAVGVLIEIWKLRRVMVVSLSTTERYFGIIPKLHIEGKSSYRGKTAEYDALAFRYLSWVMWPLVGLYAIYTLVYETHKGWYSWIINSLVGAVYTFGTQRALFG